MAKPKDTNEPNLTLLILFARDQKDYRMRVAAAHIHPGERDHVEVASKDMRGTTAWTSVPDGSSKIPCTEWLVRRALWSLFTFGPNASNGLIGEI